MNSSSGGNNNNNNYHFDLTNVTGDGADPDLSELLEYAPEEANAILRTEVVTNTKNNNNVNLQLLNDDEYNTQNGLRRRNVTYVPPTSIVGVSANDDDDDDELLDLNVEEDTNQELL